MLKKCQQTWLGRALAAGSVALLGLCLYVPAALAAEPAPEIALDASATGFTVALYEVSAGEEVDFLEAITTTGGYIGEQAGFSVEKVVRSIEGPVNGVIRYWVLTRHHNQKAMARVQAKRNEVVAPYVTELPQVRHTTVDEHQFANWGFERRQPVEFTTAQPVMDMQVLEEYGTTLAFFKYGYTGQIGWIQEFPRGESLVNARSSLLQHDGLSGASLAQSNRGGSVVTYAEFFSTPSSLAQHAKANGLSGLGTVVLNYRER